MAKLANVGGIDRLLRLVAGLALIVATLGGYIGPWGWLGLVLVATAAFRFCPLYRIVGVSSDAAP